MKKRVPFRLSPPIFVIGLLFLAILACSRPGKTEVIYVTATFPGGERVLSESPTPNTATDTPISPTPNPTRSNVSSAAPVITAGTYTVQPGDTLAQIAAAAGVGLDVLMQANNLTNPDLLEVGWTLTIPDPNTPIQTAVSLTGSGFKIVPDSEVVYSPSVATFNIAQYIKVKEGFLRAYSEEIDDEYRLGIELIDEVAKNYSLNPRLLLALLEYRGGWVNSPTVGDQEQAYPYGLFDAARTGLYKQVLDAANVLNAGYYGWKYRGLNTITFQDGRVVTLSPDINAGTAAVQYFLSRYNTVERWQRDIAEDGFFQLYLSMFGDPFRAAYEPILPANLSQPILSFPFPPNETWYFTGGPHGGYNTGSAWSSIDFAPPAPPDSLIAQQGYCYISPYWATAVAPGVIARAGGGFIILDLDFDGNEYTGWTIVYLHMADDADMVQAGTVVTTGDRLGHPSCTGGFSSATHLHFGRRYNGEWIPVDCTGCSADQPFAPMVLSGWTVQGYDNAEYQGYMENAAGDFRRAEQGRDDPVNEVRYDK